MLLKSDGRIFKVGVFDHLIRESGMAKTENSDPFYLLKWSSKHQEFESVGEMAKSPDLCRGAKAMAESATTLTLMFESRR
jgi:hypothetical protein